jgi:L-threonylcarbamoyladenylate synthase
MLEQKNTKVYTIKNRSSAERTIQKTAEVIKEGGLVCFPTETVYGVGADATNDKAVADIFRAKNRSFANPIALHLHAVEEIEKYVNNINDRARKLMEKFLPGPLMLIFEKNDNVSQIVTGGLNKVGIRVPRHELCLDFLRECGTPVAATSANRSGRLACVKADDILEELGGKIDVLLDIGATPLGIESTVLDVTSDPPRIIRPGFITMEEIAVAIGIAPIFSDNVIKTVKTEIKEETEKVHTILLEGDSELVVKQIRSYYKHYTGRNKKIGIAVTDETYENLKDLPLVRKIGPKTDPVEVARKIFEILRELEGQGAELIIVEGVPREGLGRTLMLRLGQMAEEVVKMVKGPREEPDEPEKMNDNNKKYETTEMRVDYY